MRVRRASTSCETSLTILALSLGERVVNHLASRWQMVSVPEEEGEAGRHSPPCPAARAE
jgi:hypothetical protein